MNKWTNGTIMRNSKNNENELGLKEKYPKILIEFENIVRDGRKYNLIDRFFHYSIEEIKMLENIDKQDLTENIKNDILREIENIFSELTINLINKIKYCFGLHSFSSYLNNRKTTIFDNPSLLGISPFLFDQFEWEHVIINEIKKSGYGITNLYNVEKMITNNLEEALFRLDKEEFVCLYGWNKKSISANELFYLIRSRMFETARKSKSPELVVKELIKKHIVINTQKISLTGKFNTGRLVEKLVEGFGKKNIKLTDDEKKDIQSFVSQNFKNSAGKQLVGSEIKNKSFFYTHLKLIKHILGSNSEEIKCNNKEISTLINKTFPEFLDVKTIENY
ncbi:hypothetical protein FlaCF_0132 [Flavobacterium tructae]